MAGDGTIGGPTGTTTGSTSITMPTSLGAELSSAAATCSMEAPISLTAADFMAALSTASRDGMIGLASILACSAVSIMAASREVMMAVATTAAGSRVVAVAAMVVGVAEAIDSALPLLLASPLL